MYSIRHFPTYSFFTIHTLYHDRSDYGFFRVRYQLFLVSQRVGRAAFQDAGGGLCGFEVVDEGEVCVFA
jgi:hypothetical protein